MEEQIKSSNNDETNNSSSNIENNSNNALINQENNPILKKDLLANGVESPKTEDSEKEVQSEIKEEVEEKKENNNNDTNKEKTEVEEKNDNDIDNAQKELEITKDQKEIVINQVENKEEEDNNPKEIQDLNSNQNNLNDGISINQEKENLENIGEMSQPLNESNENNSENTEQKEIKEKINEKLSENNNSNDDKIKDNQSLEENNNLNEKKEVDNIKFDENNNINENDKDNVLEEGKTISKEAENKELKENQSVEKTIVKENKEDKIQLEENKEENNELEEKKGNNIEGDNNNNLKANNDEKEITVNTLQENLEDKNKIAHTLNDKKESNEILDDNILEENKKSNEALANNKIKENQDENNILVESSLQNGKQDNKILDNTTIPENKDTNITLSEPVKENIEEKNEKKLEEEENAKSNEAREEIKDNNKNINDVEIINEKDEAKKNEISNRIDYTDSTDNINNSKLMLLEDNNINNDNIPKKKEIIEANLDKYENEDTSSDEDLIIDKSNEYSPKGIKNLGLNCYMDSLLQCLFNVPELREYFINGEFNKNTQPICYYFSKVMKELFYSNQKNVEPKKLKKLLGEKNPLFQGRKAADAADLIRSLIDSFITELSSSDDDTNEEELEEKQDKKQILQGIEKEMESNIIYKIMNIYSITEYKCPKKDHTITYSINSDSNFNFYLKGIMNSKENKNSIITLEDCFNNFIKKKSNNEFVCSQCNEPVQGESHEKIFYPPKILTIILNRGKKKKFRGEVKIDTILDISKYVDKDIGKSKKVSTYYRLICSCNHYGDSSPAGHYTATCYNQEKESYYHYNDTFLKKIDNFDYIGEPYILIYKQINKETFERTREIQNQMIIEQNEYILNEQKQKYVNTLIEVLKLFSYENKKNLDYSVDFYKSDIFIWKITIKDKKPLLMNFNNPPKFDLSSIIFAEDNKNYIPINYNIYVDLNEKPIDIYSKIGIFLKYISGNYITIENVEVSKKKCCLSNCTIF